MCFYLRSMRGLARREVKGIIQLRARKVLVVVWRGRSGGEVGGAPNVRGSILKDQEQINVTALFIRREVLMTGQSLSDLPSFLTDVEDPYLMRRTASQQSVEAGQGSTVTTVA